jgi:hypothetical protein
MAAILDRKLAYAASLTGPKLVILAASNAPFSHSCAVLERELGRPCANMGIPADIGLDGVINRTRPLLRRGDLVYLPLEYFLYPQTTAQLYTGIDAAYQFRHNPMGLSSRGPEGVIRAAFMFSLPTLVHSLGEMAISAMGVDRRVGGETLNMQRRDLMKALSAPHGRGLSMRPHLRTDAQGQLRRFPSSWPGASGKESSR